MVHKLVCKEKGLKRKLKEGTNKRRELGDEAAQSMLEFGNMSGFGTFVEDSGDFEGYVNYTRMLGDLKEALEDM